jgi:hypothetical protein
MVISRPMMTACTFVGLPETIAGSLSHMCTFLHTGKYPCLHYNACNPKVFSCRLKRHPLRARIMAALARLCSASCVQQIQVLMINTWALLAATASCLVSCLLVTRRPLLTFCCHFCLSALFIQHLVYTHLCIVLSIPRHVLFTALAAVASSKP